MVILEVTDCLHLLSQLCHMLECTSWLLPGLRSLSLLPLSGLMLLKWSAEMTPTVTFPVTQAANQRAQI